MAIGCYLFDFDGTLADCTHRLHHIKGSRKNWRAFFAACSKDGPIPHIRRARTSDGIRYRIPCDGKGWPLMLLSNLSRSLTPIHDAGALPKGNISTSNKVAQAGGKKKCRKALAS
jgi:hypothetical protein